MQQPQRMKYQIHVNFQNVVFLNKIIWFMIECRVAQVIIDGLSWNYLLRKDF